MLTCALADFLHGSSKGAAPRQGRSKGGWGGGGGGGGGGGLNQHIIYKRIHVDVKLRGSGTTNHRGKIYNIIISYADLYVTAAVGLHHRYASTRVCESDYKKSVTKVLEFQNFLIDRSPLERCYVKKYCSTCNQGCRRPARGPA